MATLILKMADLAFVKQSQVSPEPQLYPISQPQLEMRSEGMVYVIQVDEMTVTQSQATDDPAVAL